MDKEKVRLQPQYLRDLHPIFSIEPDPQFKPHAHRIAYAGEILFTVFTSLIIIELFVKSPTALVAMESLRLAGMLGVTFITIFNMFKGYGFASVDIRFYIAELLVALAVNIAAVVITSKRLAEKRDQQTPTSLSDYVSIAVPAGFTLFNLYLLGKETYRFAFLKKKTTPINSVFTLLMSMSLVVFSGVTLERNARILSSPK